MHANEVHRDQAGHADQVIKQTEVAACFPAWPHGEPRLRALRVERPSIALVRNLLRTSTLAVNKLVTP